MIDLVSASRLSEGWVAHGKQPFGLVSNFGSPAPWPIALTHQSKGSFGTEAWYARYEKYSAKWGG